MAAPTNTSAPGVYIIENLTGPTPTPAAISPSVAGFAGEHWYGIPGVAIQCNSWQDFVKYFGGFNTTSVPVLANIYLAYSVFMFFANGGQTAWVDRIVPTLNPPAAASITLNDTAATPQPTLQLSAGYLGRGGNVGSWGNTLFCDVFAMTNGGIAVPGRFGLRIYKGAYGPAFLVETWNDLSMAKTDPRYAVSILNSTSSGSYYVFATDLNDTSAFPNNQPSTFTNRQFTGGLDVATGSYVGPSPSDRAVAVTSGTSPFDYVPGVLSYNMPGEINSTVTTAAITYAQTRPSTFLVLDPNSGLTPAAAVTYFQGLSPVSSYAAMYYPWILSQNPASPNLQNSILLPPGGAVLGQMAQTDTQTGPWQSPAGVGAVLNNVIQAERVLSLTDMGTLNAANVNAIRSRNGQVIIWGVRTMQSGYASLYVPVRRTLNYIEATLSGALENNVFAPNDPQTWSTIINTCTSFLTGLLNAGAFPSTSAAQAFYVICDATNNTPQSIANGFLNVTVGVALVYPAEFIVLTIQQFTATGATSVSIG